MSWTISGWDNAAVIVVGAGQRGRGSRADGVGTGRCHLITMDERSGGDILLLLLLLLLLLHLHLLVVLDQADCGCGRGCRDQWGIRRSGYGRMIITNDIGRSLTLVF